MWEKLLSDGVIPSDKPTVPSADAVSNKTLLIGVSSTIDIRILDDINKTVNNATRAVKCKRRSFEMRRL